MQYGLRMGRNIWCSTMGEMDPKHKLCWCENPWMQKKTRYQSALIYFRWGKCRRPYQYAFVKVLLSPSKSMYCNSLYRFIQQFYLHLRVCNGPPIYELHSMWNNVEYVDHSNWIHWYPPHPNTATTETNSISPFSAIVVLLWKLLPKTSTNFMMYHCVPYLFMAFS